MAPKNKSAKIPSHDDAGCRQCQVQATPADPDKATTTGCRTKLGLPNSKWHKGKLPPFMDLFACQAYCCRLANGSLAHNRKQVNDGQNKRRAITKVAVTKSMPPKTAKVAPDAALPLQPVVPVRARTPPGEGTPRRRTTAASPMLALKHASKVGERRGGASSRSDAQLVPPSPEQLCAGVDQCTQTDYVKVTVPVHTPDASDWRYEPSDDGASASGALLAMSRAPTAAAPCNQPTRPSHPITVTVVLWGGGLAQATTVIRLSRRM